MAVIHAQRKRLMNAYARVPLTEVPSNVLDLKLYLENLCVLLENIYNALQHKEHGRKFEQVFGAIKVFQDELSQQLRDARWVTSGLDAAFGSKPLALAALTQALKKPFVTENEQAIAENANKFRHARTLCTDYFTMQAMFEEYVYDNRIEIVDVLDFIRFYKVKHLNNVELVEWLYSFPTHVKVTDLAASIRMQMVHWRMVSDGMEKLLRVIRGTANEHDKLRRELWKTGAGIALTTQSLVHDLKKGKAFFDTIEAARPEMLSAYLRSREFEYERDVAGYDEAAASAEATKRDLERLAAGLQARKVALRDAIAAAPLSDPVVYKLGGSKRSKRT